MQQLRSPISWFGGKGMLKSKILPMLPPHRHYVEPFGGGASILLAKKPAKVEVYNDRDRGLYDFFSILANPLLFPHFWSRVKMLPHSRALYDEYRLTWRGCHDPVERVVRWYVIARQSFGGRFEGSWGTVVTSSTNEMEQMAASWKSALDLLPAIHQRLQRVQIECTDFCDCLTRYRGPDYLAYCDPPYVQSTRRSGSYEHEMNDTAHEQLVDLLLGYEGAAVVSGYANPIYQRLEDAGWRRTDFETVCHSAGRTRTSGLQGKGNVKRRQKRIESVWQSPEALRRLVR